ncbi:MAG: hypothetical protein ACI8QY_000631, partial [bacterium]
MDTKKSQAFNERYQAAALQAQKTARSIAKEAEVHAALVDENKRRAEAKTSMGQKQRSRFMRKVVYFKQRRLKAFNDLARWQRWLFLSAALVCFIALILSITFLASSATVVAALGILQMVLIKVLFFGPKIIKSLFVLVKAFTRTVTGIIALKKRRNLYKSQFKHDTVTIKAGGHLYTSELTSKSGQTVTLKSSTLDYGLDGFRVMNLGIVVVCFNVVRYLLSVVVSLLMVTSKVFLNVVSFKFISEGLFNGVAPLWAIVSPSAPEPHHGNFMTGAFWMYLIFNFKSAYVRMDKPENVGPVYLAKQPHIAKRIYNEFAPNMDTAIDPSQPQTVMDALASGVNVTASEKANDVLITALTIPGVAVALVSGDFATALIFLENSGMMVGAGGNPDKHGHRIFVIDAEKHHVCIPADMNITDCFDTEVGMVICAKGTYSRPKIDYGFSGYKVAPWLSGLLLAVMAVCASWYLAIPWLIISLPWVMGYFIAVPWLRMLLKKMG